MQGLTHSSEVGGRLQVRTPCHLKGVQMIGLLVRTNKLVRLSVLVLESGVTWRSL